MTIKEVQEKILKLKKENDICILAHSYQAREITEIADFTGDSYALSKQASQVSNKNILMCGVHFMAETVKLISPEKRVLISHPEAGCAMAEMMDKALIGQVKQLYPNHKVVVYINSTAELKTICDVCVTSSSAVKIVGSMPEKDILFIPDCNLGAYVQEQLPEKNIKTLSGGCPTHAIVEATDVIKAKEEHPNALLLVHPECQPSVFHLADFVGSTSAIMEYAKKSSAKEFIIGTEISITEHLQFDCPEKTFYNLSYAMICKNMKMTTLMDVYNCVNGNGGKEIILDDQTINQARKCIDEMIKLGG
ncbi:MAG: quinolinate synthase NadA [Clostridiales bacterium]|nr:quinolinate synthase NadA [Clostridiales bacterium]